MASSSNPVTIHLERRMKDINDPMHLNIPTAIQVRLQSHEQALTTTDSQGYNLIFKDDIEETIWEAKCN